MKIKTNEIKFTDIILIINKSRIFHQNYQSKKQTSKPSVLSIYQKLFDYYGPQNWWPAESDFEVIVGAVLTQNTAWRNVEKAINNLKAHNLLTPKRLWNVSDKQLNHLIRPSGFYRIKAKRLKALLDFIIKKYAGSIRNLKKQKLSILRQELLEIPGIGEETADSILLYALRKPIFVVDAYTRRIFSRHNFFEYKTSYAKIQEFFIKHLPKSITVYQEYHALLVKLAKDYCRTKPNCSHCPLSQLFSQMRIESKRK
ncbi:MAG: endonuclease III domain-containing protein [candidate division WOR-3 bacterium]|nr:endonuclease III domain-containing protein [candidate division WOR-3 bacterium]